MQNRIRDAWLAHVISLVLALCLLAVAILLRKFDWRLSDDVLAIVVVVAVTAGFLWFTSLMLAGHEESDDFPNPEQLLMAGVVEFIVGLLLVGWLR